MPDVVDIDEHTKHRIERTDKLFRVSLILTLLLLVIMSILILIQNQINSTRAHRQSNLNHKRTQNYVRCIAESLTVEIPARNLDRCTRTVDNETKAVN